MDSAAYLGLFLAYSVTAIILTGVLLLLNVGVGAALTGGAVVVGFGMPLLALYWGTRSSDRRSGRNPRP